MYADYFVRRKYVVIPPCWGDGFGVSVVSRLDQLSGLKFDIMLFTSVFASLFTRKTWPRECGPMKGHNGQLITSFPKPKRRVKLSRHYKCFLRCSRFIWFGRNLITVWLGCDHWSHQCVFKTFRTIMLTKSSKKVFALTQLWLVLRQVKS